MRALGLPDSSRHALECRIVVSDEEETDKTQGRIQNHDPPGADGGVCCRKHRETSLAEELGGDPLGGGIGVG